MNEIEKDMFELNLTNKTEDDGNNKGIMNNLKYISNEKENQTEKYKITIVEAEAH